MRLVSSEISIFVYKSTTLEKNITVFLLFLSPVIHIGVCDGVLLFHLKGQIFRLRNHLPLHHTSIAAHGFYPLSLLLFAYHAG